MNGNAIMWRFNLIDKAIRFIKEILVKIKFRIWEIYRDKHLVNNAREIQNNMKLLPYESDFLSLIDHFCKTNKFNMNELKRYDNIRLFIFKLCLKNGINITAFPLERTKRELILKQEQREPDGFYSVVDKLKKVQLYDIKTIDVIRDCDDFIVQNISEPIYGYKAITETNGRLLAKKCEYKLNIPSTTNVRNPYTTDFQDCYLHFCTTMECVLLCPGRTDYLDSIKNYRKEYSTTIRLFRVKAEGHCVQYSGDWWVTNNLTVIEEVTKEEIYSYFMDNLDLKARVMKHLNLNHDFWDEFLKSEIPLFNNLI